MTKQITVSFYDCCLPDYFCGHHKPILQYPVDGSITRKELYNGLLSELAQDVIDYEIEQNGLDYDAIREAIKECIYFDDKRNDNDILFPELDKWSDSDDDIEHPCYAFFIIDWSDEE